MLIYKHTSKTTGLSYIGLTKFTLEQRLNEHIKESLNNSENLFHKAIREFGIEDFESIILEDGISDLSILKEREIYWIEYYNTYKNGYNMTKGGQCGSWTKESHNKGVRTRKLIGSYKGGAKKRLETIGDNIYEITKKSAETKRDNGTFKEMSEQMKGTQIGKFHICEYCGKEVKGTNFKRWHGDNCKSNPNITKEQLEKRKPGNFGIPMSEEQKVKISKARRKGNTNEKKQ